MMLIRKRTRRMRRSGEVTWFVMSLDAANADSYVAFIVSTERVVARMRGAMKFRSGIGICCKTGRKLLVMCEDGA